jgi:hypothetical protein
MIYWHKRQRQILEVYKNKLSTNKTSLKVNVTKRLTLITKYNILQPSHSLRKSGTRFLIFVNKECVKFGAEYLCKYISNRRTTHHSQFKNIKYYIPCVTANFRSSENLHNFLLNEDKGKYNFRKVSMKCTNKNTRKRIIHIHTHQQI